MGVNPSPPGDSTRPRLVSQGTVMAPRALVWLSGDQSVAMVRSSRASACDVELEMLGTKLGVLAKKRWKSRLVCCLWPTFGIVPTGTGYTVEPGEYGRYGQQPEQPSGSPGNWESIPRPADGSSSPLGYQRGLHLNEREWDGM